MIPVESSTMYGKSDVFIKHYFMFQSNDYCRKNTISSAMPAEVWVTLKEEIQTYRGSNVNYVIEDLNVF